MADVFLARQTIGGRSERLVVIKSILRGLADRPEFVTMFLEEANVAAQLQHPNIVQILDVSLLGNRPCIVMEYLNGADAAWIYRRMARREEALAPVAVAALAVGAAYGLGYAHRKTALDGTPLKIVHRDVSPHNVFVTREGLVKVLDFGIARTSQQIHTTQAGVLKGKIPYMAPEQMASQPIDGRADLFGLGVVMWELVTGHRLFRRDNEVQSMQAVLFEPIPKPSDVRSGIPEELDGIIERLLERTVDRRPESGEALARDLERFIQKQQGDTPQMILARLLEDIAYPGELDPPLEPGSIGSAEDLEVLSPHPVPDVTPSRTRSLSSLAAESTGRERGRWWLAAVLIVLFVGGIAWALGQPEDAPPAPAADVAEREERRAASSPPAGTPRGRETPAPPVVPLGEAASPPAPAPAASPEEPQANARARAKAPPRPPAPPATVEIVVPDPPAPPAPPPPRHVEPNPPAPPPRPAESTGTGTSLDSEYR